MNSITSKIKNFASALKNDTDGIRTKLAKAAGTTILSVAAGIVLSKLNEEKQNIVIINEIPRLVETEDEIVAVEEEDLVDLDKK